MAPGIGGSRDRRADDDQRGRANGAELEGHGHPPGAEVWAQRTGVAVLGRPVAGRMARRRTEWGSLARMCLQLRRCSAGAQSCQVWTSRVSLTGPMSGFRGTGTSAGRRIAWPRVVRWNLFSEGRTFPPPDELGRTRWSPTGHCMRAGRTGLEGSGPRRPAGCAGPDLGPGAGVGPALRQVVRRRAAELSRTTAGPASTRAAATRCLPLGGEARATPGRSPTSSSATTWPGSPTGLRSIGLQEGRPGQHLHGHGPRLPVAMLRAR